MGVAYYLVFDRPLGIEPGEEIIDGKAIAAANDLLNHLTQTHGLPELMSFFGMATEDAWDEDWAGMEEEIQDPPDLSSETWYSAEEGAAYFSQLLAFVDQHSDVAYPDLREELQTCVTLLRRAEAIAARWHIAIDI